MDKLDNGKVAKRGFGVEKVSFALDLSAEGELMRITSVKIPKGKKLVPKSMMVPERVSRSGSKAVSNFLCDNAGYMLGYDKKGKPEKTKEKFHAFKELHEEVLGELDDVEAKAVLKFLETWNPDQVESDPLFEDYIDEILKGGNFVFRLNGKYLIHESEAIKRAWLNYKNSSDSADMQQCLVTGEMSTIARLHPVIKGINKGQSMGNQLVSFNAEAYESYGKKQGQNAPTGEYAAFAYGAALNSLLADENHRIFIGDTTVIFWAETTRKQPTGMLSSLISGKFEVENNEEAIEDEAAVSEIQQIMKKIASGYPIDYEEAIFCDDTKIYVVGLSPNAARISVRFFIQDQLGRLAAKLTRHYEDMAIQKRFDKDFDTIPIWKIISETIPSNSKDKNPSPLLAGALLRAIMNGSEYPFNLYQAMLIRIRAEHDITHVKAAVIKAYLKRKYKYNEKIKEVLTMSLNKESDNKAYLFGRLFAVLEKLQRDSNEGIKATIAEKYLSSACSTPAMIFPMLLNLSNHHLGKFKEEGKRIYYKQLIGEILEKLEVSEEPFPKNIMSEEQGIFYLGYYQQNNENYRKRDKELPVYFKE